MLLSFDVGEDTWEYLWMNHWTSKTEKSHSKYKWSAIDYPTLDALCKDLALQKGSVAGKKMEGKRTIGSKVNDNVDECESGRCERWD